MPTFSCNALSISFFITAIHSLTYSINVPGLDRSKQIATVTLAKLSLLKREGMISL